jgi:hypothetical protein
MSDTQPTYDLVVAVGAGVILALAAVVIAWLRYRSKDHTPPE